MIKTQILTKLYSLLLLWNFVLHAVFGSPLPTPVKDRETIIKEGLKPDESKIDEAFKNRELRPENIALGIALILFGLLFCFWGKRCFKFVLFLTGAYLFASIALVMLATFEPDSGYSNRSAVYLGVVIAAGFVGGVLLVAFVKFGVFAIGVLGGYALAVWILGIGANGVIKDHTGQIIFVTVIALLTGLITVFLIMDAAIIVLTGFSGAYEVMLGIDLFARTGFKDAMGNFLGNGKMLYSPTPAIYGMLAGTVLLAIAGIVVQFMITGKKGKQNATELK
ncbi:hypothetical protein BKA69DRAFT_1046658 [Paraphysoderma sedebokerense]|nr:hypothetical protein BKA69DRAFT_1046658 [Paraphysoderma sedebokerense]